MQASATLFQGAGNVLLAFHSTTQVTPNLRWENFYYRSYKNTTGNHVFGMMSNICKYKHYGHKPDIILN